MKHSSIFLSCGLLLGLMAGIGTAMGQDGQNPGNKKIVIIYKGAAKDPAASLSLDGKEKGELAARSSIDLPVNSGSHTITAGAYALKSVACYRLKGAYGTSGGGGDPLDFVEMPFRPASLTVVTGESETTYLQVERSKFQIQYCSEVGRHPERLINYVLSEIKTQEGEKLLKKYRATK